MQASHLLVKHRWGCRICVASGLFHPSFCGKVTKLMHASIFAAVSILWLSCLKEVWNAHELVDLLPKFAE